MIMHDLLTTLRETVRTEAWYREIIERQLASIRRETARPGRMRTHGLARSSAAARIRFPVRLRPRISAAR